MVTRTKEYQPMRLSLSLFLAAAALFFPLTATAQKAVPPTETATAVPSNASASPTAVESLPASAEQPRAEDKAPARGGLLAGAKVGGLLSFGGLDPNARVGLELGYVFPWMERSFALLLDADYAAPKSSGTQAGDARVAGGTYDWHLTEQMLTLMPVAMYRYTKLGRVVPYVGIGPRIYLLRSTVRGAVGSVEIPETTEQSTKVGFGLPFGAELKLGPGGVIGEFLFEYGSLDHMATGNSNTGALSLAIGYRFLL